MPPRSEVVRLSFNRWEILVQDMVGIRDDLMKQFTLSFGTKLFQSGTMLDCKDCILIVASGAEPPPPHDQTQKFFISNFHDFYS